MKALCSRVAIASATALVVVGYWPTHGWTQTPTDNKVPAIVGACRAARDVVVDSVGEDLAVADSVAVADPQAR